MPQQVLIVIPEPEPNTRSVLRSHADVLDTIVMRGNGDIDFICGKCSAPLGQGLQSGQIRNVVLFCKRCKSYNEVP